MADFQVLDESIVFDGHVISLRRANFRAPDGTEFSREVVRHPGAVSVVAVFEDGDVVLVSQFRAPFGRNLIEIPAGKRDVEGEPIDVTAARELREEVGLTAGRMEQLVLFHNSVGFCDEESVIFLATDLTEGDSAGDGIEERYMESMRLPLTDALAMIENRQITDGKTVLGLTMAARRLGVESRS